MTDDEPATGVEAEAASLSPGSLPPIFGGGGGEAAPPAESMGASRIAAGVRFLTYQNIVNSVLGYVFLTLMLRLLTPSEYGLYSSILLVTGIGSSVAFFGLQSAATKFVAFSSERGEEGGAFARSILSLSLAFASAATVALVFLSPDLSLYFTKSASSAWIFAVSGAWLFSGTVSGIFQGLVQGMRSYESLAKILVGANLAMVCFTALGLWEFQSVLVPIAGWVLYGIVVTILSFWVARGSLLKLHLTDESKAVGNVLNYSVPLGVAGILTVITGAGDPLLVGAFLSASQMGEYFAAIAISGGLGVILFSPLNTAFFPEAATHPDNRKRLSTGLKLALRYTTLALVPVSFALAAMSRQVIGLFSGVPSTYLAADTSLRLLSVFFFLVAMQGILTSLLLSTGKTVQVMIIGAATVVLDIALSVALVPSFGILGATVSRILVDVAGLGVALYLTREFIGGAIDFRFEGKVLVTSVLIFLTLYALSALISFRPATLLPYSIVAGAVFIFSDWSMHILTDADKKNLLHFLPPYIGKYVRPYLRIQNPN